MAPLGRVWGCVGVRPIRERAGSAKPATELRRRITAKGFSVVVWWGALSKEGKKLGRWKATYRVPSLFSKRSNPALRPGPPLNPCRINTKSKHQYPILIGIRTLFLTIIASYDTTPPDEAAADDVGHECWIRSVHVLTRRRWSKGVPGSPRGLWDPPGAVTVVEAKTL